MTEDARNAHSTRTHASVMVVLLVAGAAVRILHVAANRSLSMDESFIALNVIRRDARDLLEPLDWNSGGPIGFLMIEKGLTSVLGFSEFAFRAYPLLASLAALGLFAVLATRILEGAWALCALGYFAVLPALATYAGTAKQYSGDVLVGVILLLLAVEAQRHGFRRRLVVSLGVVGALAPLLSHPAVLFLAGAGVSLLFSAWQARNRMALVRIAAMCSVWCVLAISAWLAQRDALEGLSRSWSLGYIDSVTTARNAGGELRELLVVPSLSLLYVDIGDIAAIVTGCVLVLGFVAFLRRDVFVALLLGTPLLLSILVSALGLYPLSLRTMLFVTPIISILVGAGIAPIWGVLRGRRLPTAIVVAALAIPSTMVLERLVDDMPRPLSDDGVRTAMVQLARSQAPGDTVFLNYAAQYPFAYYLTCDCAPFVVRRAAESGVWSTVPIEGSPDQFAPALSTSDSFVVGPFRGFPVQSVAPDLASLAGRNRVWVLRTFLRPEDRRAFDRLLAEPSRQIAVFGGGERIDSARLSLNDFDSRR